MSNNRITPFVKRMRTNGGTIYTFSSAVEDIGLNINERNNVVKISDFALLDIPAINFDSANLDRNFFNIKAIDGAFEYEAPSASVKDGRILIAESFENYALNFENVLLNRDDYDPTLIRTVTERVFWKWLKETGAVRFQPDVSTATKLYWSEEIDADGSLGYNSVVKYIGPVSAGNVRTDSFGTYNETYILVPTSHGQTDVYFELVEDANYKHGMEIGGLYENILGRENYTLPHPDGLSYKAYYDFVDSSNYIVGPGEYTLQYDNSAGVWSDGWWFTAEGTEPSSADNAYLTDSSIYQSTGIYNVDLQYTGGSDDFAFRRSKVDCLSIVYNLDDLKTIYGDTELTYDKMAIDYAINDSFNFNAVLIYYTVYNSTQDQILGRNLLGILFTDAPSGSSSQIGSSGIIIPSLEKIQSGPGGFGTSYSLRLNIKTDNMVDDTTATIVDQATSDQLYAEDWTEAFANLNTAVNILTQNTGTIQYLTDQYEEVQSTQTQILNDVQALQYQVNDIGRDIQGTANTVAMFADGDDPLVESSIYMKFGNVGVQTDDPQYPLEIDGTTKADDVIIENAIKDTSGNILLGYGSPLQLGSSTNYREVDIYTGGVNPVVTIDTSSDIVMDADVSILGQLQVDGSAVFYGSATFEGGIISSAFDFSADYIADPSLGVGFIWIGGYLNVDPSGVSITHLHSLYDVSLADGSLGAAQDGSSLVYDASMDLWTFGVGGAGGAGDVQWASGDDGVANKIIYGTGDGSISADSSIYIGTSNGLSAIYAGPQEAGLEIYTEGGSGISGDLNIYTGDGGGGSGNIKIMAGSTGTGSPGGNITIKAGATSNATGGDVSISGGLGSFGEDSGNIFIGVEDTSAIYLGETSIPIGTPASSEILFMDNGSSDQLKRVNGALPVTIGGTGQTSLTNNGVLTGAGTSGITASSVMTFNAATSLLNVEASIYFANENGDNIFHLDAGGSGTLKMGDIDGLGGDVILEASPLNNLTISAGGNKSFEATGGGVSQAILYYNNGQKLITESAGVDITGDITTTSDDFSWNDTTKLLAIDGSITATNDVTAYASDRRLKKNIVNIQDPLDKLDRINGVEFDWIDNIVELGFTPSNDHEVGMIAQELQAIYPQAVAMAPFDQKNGKSISGEDYLTTKPDRIIPLLVEAVKELSQRVKDLENQLNSK